MDTLCTRRVGRHKLLLMFLAATLAPLSARAVPTYTADATGGGAAVGSMSPLFFSGSAPISPGSRSATASAGVSLGASAQAAIPGTGANNGLFVPSEADASSTIDDIFISGPGSGLVPVTLHLAFHAVLTQEWTTITYPGVGTIDSTVTEGAVFIASLAGGTPFASGDLRASVNDGESVVSVNPTGTIIGTADTGPFSTDTSESGIITTKNLHLDSNDLLTLTLRIQTPITSDTFGPGAGYDVFDELELRGELLLSTFAPINQALTLNLSLSVNATALPGYDQGSSGEIDALQTFGIDPDAATVFDLPDGYTANSNALQVVNNIQVPEPATLAIFSASLFPLFKWRKSRR